MIRNYSDYNQDTQRMVEFTEKAPEQIRGKRLPILSPSGFPDFSIIFTYKVDMQTLDVMSTDDPSYAKSPLPTLNDLMQSGVIREWYPYKDAHFYNAERCRQRNGRLDMDAIVDYFKEQGLTVSKEAIRHNWKDWKAGFKSGFRDEKNGTHVFSPCGGCNPFNIHVSSLYEGCEDWQKTYTC